MRLRQRLAPLRAAAPKVLLRVAIVLGLLEAAYLLLANLALMTPLLRSVVNPADDVEIDYDWAYSPWPGRLYVKNLALRIEDYNVQFFVGVERGTLDVRLEELARRRFHAVRVSAEGTTFRMRHKLHEVGKNARRVAAYPPIAGFSDPPLYRGPPPPPIPDSEYALWDVRIENVETSVREVWVLEYRLRGRGRAWGSFHVRPARWYEVEDSGLKFEQGSLTVADVPIGERAKLEVLCRVLGTDPRSGSGLEPLRTIFASVSGTLERADLRALDVYLVPLFGLSATGRADIQLGVKMDAGVIRENSRITVETHDLGVGKPDVSVWGEPQFELSVPVQGGANGMLLEARARRLRALGATKGVASPYLEDLRARLELTRELARPLRVLSASLEVPKLVAPELAWFEPLFTDTKARLRGAASAELTLARTSTKNWHGEAAIELTGLNAEVAALALGGHFELKSRFSATEDEQSLALENFRFRADGATLVTGGRRTPPWAATISSNDLVLASFDPLRARGMLDVKATRTEPLLPLVVKSSFLRELLVAGLGLRSISGRARFEIEPVTARVEVPEARSGAVTARGFFETRRGGQPDGRFLLVTNLANVGVRIDDGETSVKPLVSDDWLSKSAFVLPRNAN